MASPPPDGAELKLLIQDVAAASKLPPKARATSIKPTVASLVSLAYDQGLDSSDLAELTELVTASSFLDQAALAAIVKNLYPAADVSRDVVLRILSSLGHGAKKPSLAIQAALIRWLILVYHVVEAPPVFTQAYTILFNLLDTAAIRPPLSHLLALITRRRHVKPFRIQMLLNLSRQSGGDPSLVGLLRVFKDYYPEIIVGDVVRGRASAFKHPDSSWRQRLDEIQEAHQERFTINSSAPRNGFRTTKSFNRARKNRVVPNVYTSHATPNSTTLEEIDSATSLAKNIDKVELPSQLVAVLADPLLQKLMLLRPSADAYQRTVNWLESALQDVMDGDADEASLWEVLDVVKDFVSHTQTLPASLLNFFAGFLPRWTGASLHSCIFEILSYAPFHEFDELHKHIYGPLERIALDDTPESQMALLFMYTNLLTHWTTLLKSTDEVPESSSKNVAALVKHVNPLCMSLSQTAPGLATESAILDFYEQSVRLIVDDRLVHHIRIELPHSLLIYTLFFSSSLASVSRMCLALACYKKGFETAMLTRSRQQGSQGIDSASYARAYVNHYNGFLMDVCNCFWRSRAFSIADANSMGCMVPRGTVEALKAYVPTVDRSTSLVTLFSLSMSPVLCLLSITRVRELEDAELERDGTLSTRHAGPVTQESIKRLVMAGGLRLSWQEYRAGVLEALSRKGFHGVTDLLKNTMTVLRNSTDGKGTPSQASQ